MEAPAITRHRRPFLAPLWLSLLAVLVVALVGLTLYRNAGTTVVLLVRTPERDPGAIADPPLSAEEEERAQRLARLFGDAPAGAGLDAVYVSDDRRAQQTAAPLAERLHREPTVFAGAEAAGTAGRLLQEHAGGAVLVIAGGNSFAQMLRRLAGADAPTTAAEESDVVYLLSIPSYGRARLLRLRL
jgi:broad specificity phosphatase PhoE